MDSSLPRLEKYASEATGSPHRGQSVPYPGGNKTVGIHPALFGIGLSRITEADEISRATDPTLSRNDLLRFHSCDQLIVRNDCVIYSDAEVFYLLKSFCASTIFDARRGEYSTVSFELSRDEFIFYPM